MLGVDIEFVEYILQQFKDRTIGSVLRGNLSSDCIDYCRYRLEIIAILEFGIIYISVVF